MFKLDDLIDLTELPDELRSGHWYNDLQHSMLVVLLRRALLALGEGKAPLANRLMDTLTLYLYVHFLDEEEGMAASLAGGLHDRDWITAHVTKHEAFLKVWDQTILFPLKDGAPLGEVRDSLVRYYNVILKHIAEDDLHTYGAHGPLTGGNKRAEIAHVATTALPLSPYMRGALEVVRLAAPETARRINRDDVPVAALDRLPETAMAAWSEPLLPGRRCVRDAVLAARRGFVRSMTARAA